MQNKIAFSEKKGRIMYILEVIAKLLQEQRNKKKQIMPEDEGENYEKCEHIFVPVDSTGDTLACSKCGLAVKKNKLLKPNNFFGKRKK